MTKGMGWKLLALAMVGEGAALCIAPACYLQKWKRAVSAAGRVLTWLEEHDQFTRKLGKVELGVGLLLFFAGIKR